MKYKLAFVNDIKNFPHDFLYKDELKGLMIKHDMFDDYQKKIYPVDNFRWSSKHVFSCLEEQK